MKKYPVHYKGKEYEVRWKDVNWGEFICIRTLYIYEVKRIFTFKIYIKKFEVNEDEIIDRLRFEGIINTRPNFYIEEIKMLFKEWEKYSEYQITQQSIQTTKDNTLLNWDGVIN